LFDVKHLVYKTIEPVHAFLENFETAKEVVTTTRRVLSLRTSLAVLKFSRDA